jgi:hypothetical protein
MAGAASKLAPTCPESREAASCSDLSSRDSHACRLSFGGDDPADRRRLRSQAAAIMAAETGFAEAGTSPTARRATRREE